MIPKSLYFQFIDKQYENGILTECQMKALKDAYVKKEYKIIEVESNHQISEFFKITKKTKKQYEFYRFYSLLIHFVSNDYALRIIQKIRQNPNVEDQEVIKWINQAKEDEKKPEYFSNNKTRVCKQKNFYFEIIAKQVKASFKKRIIEKSFENEKQIKYLDVGCGNGSKTIFFAKKMKIPMNQVYGSDILSWGPYSKRNLPFDFEPIYENGLLHFEDNKFDLVTSFLTLHHIKNLNTTLSEIKRVLKPNGIFLIIEHDCLTQLDFLIVNIQHLLYHYMYDVKKNPNEWKNKNYIKKPIFQKYYNFMEWDFILSKYGFRWITGNKISESMSEMTTYDNKEFSIYQITK
jgi:ubiquinone/menaquinone biosynthesis C-methylase UbiE